MAFIGKTYKHEKDENLEAFIDSLGVPPNLANEAKNSKPEQKLLKNGDTYTLVSTYAISDKEVHFKSGVEFDETLTGGLKSKTTFTVNGNTITQLQKLDDEHIVTLIREYSEDKLVVTITSNFWDGTARRYYKAV